MLTINSSPQKTPSLLNKLTQHYAQELLTEQSEDDHIWEAGLMGNLG